MEEWRFTLKKDGAMLQVEKQKHGGAEIPVKRRDNEYLLRNIQQEYDQKQARTAL
jgi:hypothetical protein